MPGGHSAVSAGSQRIATHVIALSLRSFAEVCESHRWQCAFIVFQLSVSVLICACPSYRVVAVVAGNSEAVTLSGLRPDTQYQVSVAAVWGGRKYRSRPIVFRTLGTSYRPLTTPPVPAPRLTDAASSAPPTTTGTV